MSRVLLQLKVILLPGNEVLTVVGGRGFAEGGGNQNRFIFPEQDLPQGPRWLETGRLDCLSQGAGKQLLSSESC